MHIWFERVSTDDNISDLPSREEYKLLAITSTSTHSVFAALQSIDELSAVQRFCGNRAINLQFCED